MVDVKVMEDGDRILAFNILLKCSRALVVYIVQTFWNFQYSFEMQITSNKRFIRKYFPSFNILLKCSSCPYCGNTNLTHLFQYSFEMQYAWRSDPGDAGVVYLSIFF